MNTNTTSLRRSARRAGLTLIELVMVLIILASLAALIVPIVDNIRRQSDKTTASAAIKQVVENISLYRTQRADYPNQLDSLVDSAGGALYSAVPASGKLALMPLSDDEAKSLTKAGINTIMDHNTDNGYRGLPGNSGIVPKAVATGAEVAVVTNADILASVYPEQMADNDGTGGPDFYDSTNKAIVLDVGDDGAVGGGDDTTARVVALGIGPNNTAVGKTMVSPPAYASVDGRREYNRFIGMFAVYDIPGNQYKRAQLKGGLDSKGDFLNQELNEIAENEIE